MDAVIQLKEMGFETHAIAMAKDGPAADEADYFEMINILDEHAVIDYIQKHDIDVVYSVGSDLAMPAACKISEKLDLPCFVSFDTAYICNHKNCMRETLTLNCDGNVPYQVMEEPEEVIIKFPVILKPSDAQGQRGIFLINSQEELEEHFEEAKKFSRSSKVIVEKYIEGPEVSVNGYMVNGSLKFLAVSDRETWPQFTGLIHKHIVPAQTISEKATARIWHIFEDACKRVGIQNGPVYFQMKVEGDQPYIIEMTPRLDGCHMWNILSRSSGVNLIKLCFEHLIHGDTSELENLRDGLDPMELVFFCQEPNTTMDRDRFTVPEEAEDHFWYYESGDHIRPVNGRYDKIGYYIQSID